MGKGIGAQTPTPRIFIVDDFEPIRLQLRCIMQERPGWQVIAEAADGPEAIQKAQELRPDLILLDLGLPRLSGIEVARRVRQLCPTCKVLFLSQELSAAIAQEAISTTGAWGYVAKVDARRQLLLAVEAVLRGEQFLSSSIISAASVDTVNEQPSGRSQLGHEVAFYPDDRSFVRGFSCFVEQNLKIGNVVIVIASEPHRAKILERLRADGVEVSAAIEQQQYIPLDAADTLAKFTEDGFPDRVRFVKVVSDVILAAAKTAKRKNRQLVVCGECAPTLLVQGKADAAIQLERLWDEHVVEAHGISTLCGYLSHHVQNTQHSSIFQSICAEHSEVYGANIQ
jgi:DNA-binding NarL/FixJ family response regulator